MTYSTTITNQHQHVRALVKIAGVPRWLSTWGNPSSDTWDDSAHGNHLGADLPLQGDVTDISISPGTLDYKDHAVSATTCTISVMDSSWLRGIFGRRASTQEVENNPLTAAGAAITIGDNTGFADGDYVHIDKECIELSGTTGGAQLDVEARGALGTTAAAHQRSSLLSTTPRHWKGRKMWVVLATNNNGTWEYEDPWFVLHLDQSPSFSNGVWTLHASNSLGHFDRPLYQGFQEQGIIQLYYSELSGYPVLCFEVESSDRFLESSDTTKQPLAVLLKSAGSAFCAKVYDVGTNIIYCAANTPNLLGAGGHLRGWVVGRLGNVGLRSGDLVSMPGATARPVYPMTLAVGNDGDPADIALKLMCSNLGDETVNAYDLLPGEAETSSAEAIRAGAGLSTDDVDVTSWEDAWGRGLGSRGYLLGAEPNPPSLVGFLKQYICPMLQGYAHVADNTGKLTFKPYQPATTSTATTLTITNDNMLWGGDNFVDDEGSALSRIVCKAGYNYLTGEYSGTHIAHFVENQRLYGDTSSTLEIATPLMVDYEEEARGLFDLYFGRWGDGAQRFNVKVPWSGHLVRVGDAVTYTNSRIPNGESSTLGVSSLVCEVVSVGVDFDAGTVSLELVRRPTCKLIAPTALLGSNVAGNQWNVSALYSDASTLATEWAVGWKVRFITAAGVVHETDNAYATISAVTTTTMTFTDPPSDIAQDDIIIFADYDDADSTATNTESSADQRDHAFLDTGYNPSTAAHRWG